MLFADSDLVEVVKILSAVIGPVLMAYVAYLGVKITVAQKAAAVEVKEVKETLGDVTDKQGAKIDSIARTGERTHALVNSAHGVQLRLVVDLSREKADRTKLPADIAAADKADILLREHEAGQALADQVGDRTKPVRLEEISPSVAKKLAEEVGAQVKSKE